MRIIDAPEDAKAGETVVIRSHGVPPEVIEKLKALGVDYKDATCPYVQKIHRLVSDGEREGRCVMLAGDAKHPEVGGHTRLLQNAVPHLQNARRTRKSIQK